MKSKKFRVDQQVQKLAEELEKIKNRYLQNLRKKQDPLFKKIAALDAKAKGLKYNRTGDPCPDCKGTGQMIEYVEEWSFGGRVLRIKEKKVPCKYCRED